jgi:hypothetical protein
MPDDPTDRDRSTEAAEDARRRLDSSEDRFAREREEEHELELVREQLRRHDRDLRQDEPS